MEELHRLSVEEFALVQAYRRSTALYREMIREFSNVAAARSARGKIRRLRAFCVLQSLHTHHQETKPWNQF
jgi:hypothetical protein